MPHREHSENLIAIFPDKRLPRILDIHELNFILRRKAYADFLKLNLTVQNRDFNEVLHFKQRTIF